MNDDDSRMPRGRAAEYSQDMTILFKGEDVPLFTIPDTVQFIDDSAFGDFTSLEEVIIPDSVREIDICAFENCTSLRNVRIPSSVRSIGDYAFAGCTSASFTVDEDNGSYSSENGALFDKDGKTLISGYSLVHDGVCIIPDHVVSIAKGAFESCGSLVELILPDSVVSIESTAFQYCGSLRTVRIPRSLTEIESMSFTGCDSVSFFVDERNGCYSSKDGALYDKSGEKLLLGHSLVRDGRCTIPDSVIEIGPYAFDDCGSLREVRIPPSVLEISKSAFFNCEPIYFVVDERNRLYYSSNMGELCIRWEPGAPPITFSFGNQNTYP